MDPFRADKIAARLTILLSALDARWRDHDAPAAICAVSRSHQSRCWAGAGARGEPRSDSADLSDRAERAYPGRPSREREVPADPRGAGLDPFPGATAQISSLAHAAYLRLVAPDESTPHLPSQQALDVLV